MKNRDIIISGLQDFDISIGSNCVNLAKEFAKNNRVLYVNFPLDRFSKFRHYSHPLIKKRREIQQKQREPLIKIHDNFWSFTPDITIESIAKIPNKQLFDFLNKRNNKKFANSIKKVIEELNFKNYIFFQDSDVYRSFYLKELLNPDLYIYYSRDNLIETDYYKNHGKRIESAHIAKADMVVANSNYLASYARNTNPKSWYVGQGCDVSAFDSTIEFETPDEIKKIDRPIIGYIGALKSLRLDINLLIQIAKSKPNWNLVLIGEEDSNFKKSELHRLENVYFLGQKPQKQLPMWLSQFDIAINPQKVNKVTIGNYPRKIDEYLAMGKPTVATKTEAMDIFDKHVYLANDADEYIYFIDKILSGHFLSTAEEKIKFAKKHTWENNANKIYQYIEEFQRQ